MSKKLSPISVHAPAAPGTLLTAVLTRTGGDAATGAVALGGLIEGFFSVDYTPAGALSRMLAQVQLSGDAPGTALASVARWETVPVLDATVALASGLSVAWAEQTRFDPHPAGAITYCVRFDARKHHFARILLADSDGAGAPGSVTAIRMGGTA